jgi:hypothetical protein
MNPLAGLDWSVSCWRSEQRQQLSFSASSMHFNSQKFGIVLPLGCGYYAASPHAEHAMTRHAWQHQKLAEGVW